MDKDDSRLPLGDRVQRSLRNWLGQFGLKRGSTRADALNQFLDAGRTVDAGGADPVQLLELAAGLQRAGVDPVKLLAPPHGRARR